MRRGKSEAAVTMSRRKMAPRLSPTSCEPVLTTRICVLSVSFSVGTLPVTSVSDPDPNLGKPNQCGSEIRIGNADPDTGARKFTKINK
jgi:hypothetical protein